MWSMATWATVLLEYQSKLDGLHASGLHVQATQSRFGLITGALGLVLVLGILGYVLRAGTSWYPILFAPAVVWSYRRYLAYRRESYQISRLARLYESGIGRINGNWAGSGVSGEEFSRDGHLYEKDLNIFGRGSMFELLCAARSEIGKRRLASYLLDLPEMDETLARQAAVKELAPQSDLREKAHLLGPYSFQDSQWEPFDEWQKSPTVSAPPLQRWILFVNSALLALMILIPWAAGPGNRLWAAEAPFLIAALIAQAAFGFFLQKRVRPALEGMRRIGHELQLFRLGIELLETREFHSVKLKRLVDAVKGAGREVRRLEQLIDALDQCSKDWFYVPSLLLLAPTQLALAVEQWRARHSRNLTIWLDAWAEFEALNSLAAYAHEHPEDVFPELADVPGFEVDGLGHPLLPESVGVRNDVHLGSARRFYLVSGSNMAGKSTLLRAIGINAVLAAAGAPIRALRARTACFAVCACVSVVDSLAEGRSKFMAEVERLRQTLCSAAGPRPVLFVIDEILSGTNSGDRRVAAASYMRALSGAGAIGALSTHDLALTEIAEQPELGGINVHMESRDPSDPFGFDYLLKPGVSAHSNAVAIARLAGVAS